MDQVSDFSSELSDDGAVFTFFKAHFLHWLESLSLLQRLPGAVLLIEQLQATLIKVRLNTFIPVIITEWR